ncbi:MAG: hypothetical protein KQJ78_07620 [Deltaproteobacteria bacterium]|nr:hypothetical protein [Deltaproteobacteria bacterium]
MNAELSRRAARVMNTRAVIFMPRQEKKMFIEALEKAHRFNDLDKKWQETIVEAEKEAKG